MFKLKIQTHDALRKAGTGFIVLLALLLGITGANTDRSDIATLWYAGVVMMACVLLYRYRTASEADLKALYELMPPLYRKLLGNRSIEEFQCCPFDTAKQSFLTKDSIVFVIIKIG